MGEVLFFIVFVFFVTTIARYDGFGNSNSTFDDAFSGFVGDFYRYSDDFMHTSLQHKHTGDDDDKL